MINLTINEQGRAHNIQRARQQNIISVQPEKPFALRLCKSPVQRIALPNILLPKPPNSSTLNSSTHQLSFNSSTHQLTNSSTSPSPILDNHLQFLAHALRLKGCHRVLEERPLALHRDYAAKKWQLVGHVDRVEIFMQASRPHPAIIYSRSYTEGSDTFARLSYLPSLPKPCPKWIHPAETVSRRLR